RLRCRSRKASLNLKIAFVSCGIRVLGFTRFSMVFVPWVHAAVASRGWRHAHVCASWTKRVIRNWHPRLRQRALHAEDSWRADDDLKHVEIDGLGDGVEDGGCTSSVLPNNRRIRRCSASMTCQ